MKTYTPIDAGGCICGRHLLESMNEGTCLLCGHGDCKVVSEHAYANLLANRHSGTGVRVPFLSSRFSVPADRGGRPRLHPIKRTTRPKKWTEEMILEAAHHWRMIHGHVPTSNDWHYGKGFQHPCWVTVLKCFGGVKPFRQAMAEIPMERLAA